MEKEIVLNKTKYNDSGVFQEKYIEEYCNLKIYPLVGTLEEEAGLLSDFAEAYKLEGKPVNFKVYGNSNLESIQFIKDNLLNFVNFESSSDTFLSYVESFTNEPINSPVVLGPDNLDVPFFKKVSVYGFSKVLYLSKEAFEIFGKYFWYYINPEGVFKYSNLICYTMIIKNGGPLLEQVLTENLPVIDRWCILDTGSTDGTQETIRRVLKNKKGTLYEEPFVDFKVSRNRCLELAGHSTKFILMLDDTYSVRGDLRTFLTEVRGDQFSDSFSMLIQSDDTEYYSNRIIKSKTNLRYIHTIHEVITDQNNINVTVPNNKAIIFDHRADYMEKRTNDRKQFDLELLFKEVEEFPDDPRALYYIAQTYGCIGDELRKAEYFEKRINHPVQGYFQEKIDACFELARTYNFKINPFTKESFEDYTNISEEHWEICKNLYLQAYSLDTKRPDSLYFIGIHYYLKGNYKEAYDYFKSAFDVGYPVGSQYSLKPTLSFHFLPKFLAEVSYYFSDFKYGFAASQLFLTSTKFNGPDKESWNMMSNWYKIYQNLVNLPEISKNPKSMDKPIYCIVTDGGWEPWTGEDILTKGLGGSETWIVEMAKWISRIHKFHVVVFCKTDKSRFFENVGYNPIELFGSFVMNTVVEYCIVSRFTEYVPLALHGHAQNVGVIFHDNLSPELVVPVHPKLKWLYGLTEWHAGCIKNIFPQFNVSFINYGVDSSKFKLTKKTRNSFIYSSFPNRGLVVLLRMWPKIIYTFPDATLNIFCNLEHAWTNQVAPEMMNEIKKLLKINKKGITLHGWVAKDILAEWWSKTEFWLYPCIFEETFCLTALEAAISRTCVITNGLAALSETAKNGITIPGNPLEKEWQKRCLETLFELMKSPGKKELSVNNNYLWAKNMDWESQAKKFMKQIK
jgi:hypothetical protein